MATYTAGDGISQLLEAANDYTVLALVYRNLGRCEKGSNLLCGGQSTGQ